MKEKHCCKHWLLLPEGGLFNDDHANLKAIIDRVGVGDTLEFKPEDTLLNQDAVALSEDTPCIDSTANIHVVCALDVFKKSLSDMSRMTQQAMCNV